MSSNLREISEQLKKSDKKVQLIYGFNGAGKTRLSRDFKELLLADIGEPDSDGATSDLSRKNVLYFNAFTEDLFYWDNDLSEDIDRKLKIHPNAFTRWVLREQGQGPSIVEYFQRLASTSIEPQFSSDFSEISFSRPGNQNQTNIKISKGEESNLIWSIFYSFLSLIAEELSSDAENRSTNDFDGLKYVFVDDPVSSLDDSHLIELAVDLAKLIKRTTSGLKFIITTHNPLFYNILSNELNNKLTIRSVDDTEEVIYRPRETEKYRLDKLTTGNLTLTALDRRTPFSYHLLLLSEIRTAISDGKLKKYHFNFLRNIFEKTATFLGHDEWEKLLPQTSDGNPDPFANRIMNLSSHSAHAGEETGEIEANDREKLEELVNFLSSEYGFWRPTED